jgi:hypothetical protein
MDLSGTFLQVDGPPVYFTLSCNLQHPEIMFWIRVILYQMLCFHASKVYLFVYMHS